MASGKKALLSSVLPPLICGTATFNSLYNVDPYKLPTTEIVHRAFTLGIRAFDTSPYYGPSEELLGKALDTAFVREGFRRDEYFLLTKVGRIASEEFDYSPAWIRYSVERSLQRLRTDYLDVVYCHDVEFVSPQEVLSAVIELRRIRDTAATIKYVGISGYPVDQLAHLSEFILKETGEPLDIVMSYANYTLQNTRLLSRGIPRLLAAGIDVVPNASLLGMGLLRSGGIPIGGQGDFHPAPNGLRAAVRKASEWTAEHGERLEKVAIRYAFESWMRNGRAVGSRGDVKDEVSEARVGVNVMGVSSIEELEETVNVWKSVVEDVRKSVEAPAQHGVQGKEGNDFLVDGIRKILGEYVDFVWDSPAKGFVNKRGNESRITTLAA